MDEILLLSKASHTTVSILYMTSMYG